MTKLSSSRERGKLTASSHFTGNLFFLLQKGAEGVLGEKKKKTYFAETKFSTHK